MTSNISLEIKIHFCPLCWKVTVEQNRGDCYGMLCALSFMICSEQLQSSLDERICVVEVVEVFSWKLGQIPSAYWFSRVTVIFLCEQV